MISIMIRPLQQSSWQQWQQEGGWCWCLCTPHSCKQSWWFGSGGDAEWWWLWPWQWCYYYDYPASALRASFCIFPIILLMFLNCVLCGINSWWVRCYLHLWWYYDIAPLHLQLSPCKGVNYWFEPDFYHSPHFRAVSLFQTNIWVDIWVQFQFQYIFQDDLPLNGAIKNPRPSSKYFFWWKLWWKYLGNICTKKGCPGTNLVF